MVLVFVNPLNERENTEMSASGDWDFIGDCWEPVKRRVRFSAEVEVLEYRPWEDEYRREAVRCRVEELLPASPLLGAFCMAAIFAIIGFQWLNPSY